VGFNEEEVDVFDLSAAPSKSDDYGTETNVFSVEYNVPERKQASLTQAALSSAPVSVDDEEEFDLSGAGSASIDDDDDFPVENEGLFSKIKGMIARPKDDADIDFDVDGDILDSDEFQEEKEGFFAKLKGIFFKPADIDDFDDDLPDDYTPVLDNDDGDDVFDLSASAAAPSAAKPEFETVKSNFEAPEPEFEAVRVDFEAPEPEFEAVEPEFEAIKAEFEAFGSEPEPVFEGGVQRSEEGDEFDLSASIPPVVPVLLPPPVFNRFAHVCLRVKDLGASVDFYTKFGFTKRFAFNKNGGLFGVYLEFGNGNFIELFADARRDVSANCGSLAHFCLETPDIDAVMESLSSRGIEYTPKKLGSDSTYQIWLKDPDGNEFEIHQYTSESSQVVGRDVEADW
jgi:lactoylglutathione lyase/glyoxylase I family protein